jgi:L-rhamnose mutarotase
MQTFLLVCDLKNEPEAIQAYVQCHRQVDPVILESIRDAGILEMSIYRWSNRLSMVLHTSVYCNVINAGLLWRED